MVLITYLIIIYCFICNGTGYGYRKKSLVECFVSYFLGSIGGYNNCGKSSHPAAVMLASQIWLPVLEFSLVASSI